MFGDKSAHVILPGTFVGTAVVVMRKAEYDEMTREVFAAVK